VVQLGIWLYLILISFPWILIYCKIWSTQACLFSWFSVCFGFLFLGDTFLWSIPCGHSAPSLPLYFGLVNLSLRPLLWLQWKRGFPYSQFPEAFSPLHFGSTLRKSPISFGSFSGLLSTWIIERCRNSKEY
jgi:hypothetical protein